MIHQIQSYKQSETRGDTYLDLKKSLETSCDWGGIVNQTVIIHSWRHILIGIKLSMLIICNTYPGKSLLSYCFHVELDRYFKYIYNVSGFFWWFLFSSTVLKCTQYSLVRCSMIKWTDSWIIDRSISWTDLFFFCQDYICRAIKNHNTQLYFEQISQKQRFKACH